MTNAKSYAGKGLPCTTPSCENDALRGHVSTVQYQSWSYALAYGITGEIVREQPCGAPLCGECLRRAEANGGCWICKDVKPNWVDCERCGRPCAEHLCAGCESFVCSWCALHTDQYGSHYCKSACEKLLHERREDERRRREEPTLFEQGQRLPF